MRQAGLNRIVTVAFSIICFTVLIPAIAEELSAEERNSVHSFEVGPEISWIRYSEPGIMHEEGIMYGINASYIYRGPLFAEPAEADRWMLRADGRASWGQVDYHGQLMGGTEYDIDNVDDYILEFRGLVGYGFQNNTTRTTPYSGFGYRYLNDDSSDDPLGYERESNYFYVPIGVELDFPSESEWSLSTTLEFDFLLWGSQKSHLGGSDGTITNDQDKGYGLRTSVRLQKRGDKADFAIQPFIRYWDINKSDTDDGFVEPENHSVEVGLGILWQF